MHTSRAAQRAGIPPSQPGGGTGFRFSRTGDYQPVDTNRTGSLDYGLRIVRKRTVGEIDANIAKA